MATETWAASVSLPPEGGLLYVHDRDGVVLVDDRDDAAGKESVQGVPDIYHERTMGFGQ